MASLTVFLASNWISNDFFSCWFCWSSVWSLCNKESCRIVARSIALFDPHFLDEIYIIDHLRWQLFSFKSIEKKAPLILMFFNGFKNERPFIGVRNNTYRVKVASQHMYATCKICEWSFTMYLFLWWTLLLLICWYLFCINVLCLHWCMNKFECATVSKV